MNSVTIPLSASIQAAINANPAGTVFQLAAGTYRNQQFEALTGDQFIGDPSGDTVLSGALVLNQWTQSGAYYVESGLPTPLIGQTVAGSSAMASALNDLFINNMLYIRVSSLSLVTAGHWYFNSTTNSAYISDNPAGKTVEYSVTPNMTYDNGATGVVFQNLSIEKYATDAQTGPIQGGVDWHINNVTSTQNHGAGLNIGAGTIVQGGSYIDNGQVGIDGYLANGAQILNATIADNNYAGYDPEWDAGGIKLSTSANVVISSDNVYGNASQGIWADIDSTNWTVSNNTVTNNTGAGIQYEISHGNTTISNNTVSGNTGAGIFISNSDGVTVTGNTVAVGATNTGSATATADGGIAVINTSRGSGPDGLYQSVNDTVTHNTIVHTTDSATDGIYYYQPISGTANNVWSNNTYYAANSTAQHWYFNSTTYTWNQLQQAQPYGNPGTLVVGTPAAASVNDTVVLAGSSGAITDSSGNAWMITSGRQVAINGVADTTTAGVIELAYVNGTIWQENGNHLWWGETQPNASWGPSSGTVSPLPVAATTTTATATQGTITLDISEDAWQGDAQFIVTVDGTQVGGAQTASVLHSSGDTGVFTLTGSWSTGAHSVQVQFINDAYGGTPSTDRNLYVDSIAFNGTTESATTATLYSNGTSSFTVGGSTAAAAAPADMLTLNLAEDAWNGNAQFTFSVDGKQVSTAQDVVASHSAGAWEALSFAGAFGAGSHTIGITFTNDAYGGTPSTDRNLYINGIDLNGQHYGSGVSTLYSNGTQTFSVTTTH